MEFGHDNVRRVVELDRLSSLPDELIHKIMSCFDMKFVVRTCLLSSRWKLLWTSMPYLNFSSRQFPLLREFAQFVTHVLSHRNHQVDVSSVKLNFDGAHIYKVFIEKIVNYAFSHNVQDLRVVNFSKSKRAKYRPSILSSQSLKDFRLISFFEPPRITLKKPLCFPALITLCLCGVLLRGDLFSKCVNLKDLTLACFNVVGHEEVFDIITPRLTNLSLLHGSCSKVMNLIAPQLENLTVESCSIGHLNAPPGLSSFCYRDNFHHLPMSTIRFHPRNKVTIKPYKKENARKIVNMLQKLHNVRYLTLHVGIVECISSFPDLLLHHPSPFSNLICLTIYPDIREDGYKVQMSTAARNFLLKNSPSATLVMTHEISQGLLKIRPT